MKKATSIVLLREVANAVDRHGESQVIAALRSIENAGERQASLPLRSASKGRALGAQKGSARPNLRAEIVSSVGERLRTLESREAGLSLVGEANLTRRELEALARRFDVPVRKDVRAPDLQELIVNVTIGARLNSQAIRGQR